MKSIKNPAINIIKRTNITNSLGDRFAWVIRSMRTLSPYNPLKTNENEVAPIRIKNTVEVR